LLFSTSAVKLAKKSIRPTCSDDYLAVLKIERQNRSLLLVDG
jgi:hypothetical protein